MKKEIIITSDGSSSIYLPDLDETYHSKHGAIQEAYHVFIKQGLDNFKKGSNLDILEIGFGTGLNCFITFLESFKRDLTVNYEGIEVHPLTMGEIFKLNYIEQLSVLKFESIFKKMHEHNWNVNFSLDDNFNLIKRLEPIEGVKDKKRFDLIYFDAFGPRVQPELWTTAIFKKMFDALKMNGILVTYSAKGNVRRSLIEVGFKVERLPGPKGKREMLRGTK